MGNLLFRTVKVFPATWLGNGISVCHCCCCCCCSCCCSCCCVLLRSFNNSIFGHLFMFVDHSFLPINFSFISFAYLLVCMLTLLIVWSIIRLEYWLFRFICCEYLLSFFFLSFDFMALTVHAEFVAPHALTHCVLSSAGRAMWPNTVGLRPLRSTVTK